LPFSFLPGKQTETLGEMLDSAIGCIHYIVKVIFVGVLFFLLPLGLIGYVRPLSFCFHLLLMSLFCELIGETSFLSVSAFIIMATSTKLSHGQEKCLGR
jgi:hypothetical protein